MFNGVVGDTGKAVLGNLKATARDVLDGVVVDNCRGAPIDRDAERAADNGEAFDRDFTGKNLDRWLALVRRIDRGLQRNRHGMGLAVQSHR